MSTYRIVEDSIQEHFFNSRAKIQGYCGGFANGKTSAVCIRAIELATDYPGSNGLIARATYPKLRDTIKKEFHKWCPPHFIKSENKQEGEVILTNGTTITFRHIKQTSSSGSTTSNLLSANLDWAIVDQIEDPEIVYKDFLDLLGRLRGSTRYIGKDKSMPLTGTRWLIFTANPTANWVYKKLVKPLHLYRQTGIVSDDLIWDVDTNKPAIEIFEGSTYVNKNNLPSDYIKTLEATYSGQMRERYIEGKWGSFEGLIYSNYSLNNIVTYNFAKQYYFDLIKRGFQPTILEGYDHGIAVPSCYLFSYVDERGNVILLDGFYEAELEIEEQVNRINNIREKYYASKKGFIFADPAIFRRSIKSKLIGKSIADMFNEQGILMQRGNNEIINGITKVSGYVNPHVNHIHIYTGDQPSPYMYIADSLYFVNDEFDTYMWATDVTGERVDKPIDKNDHAMDTIKYLMSKQPSIAQRILINKPVRNPLSMWHEQDIFDGKGYARYL